MDNKTIVSEGHRDSIDGVLAALLTEETSHLPAHKVARPETTRQRDRPRGTGSSKKKASSQNVQTSKTDSARRADGFHVYLRETKHEKPCVELPRRTLALVQQVDRPSPGRESACRQPRGRDFLFRMQKGRQSSRRQNPTGARVRPVHRMRLRAGLCVKGLE